MCTVTIIPQAQGVRLAANRDEARSRPSALPPRVVRVADRRLLLPIDPQSGGTWIAANDAGLMLTLLNANPRPYAPPTRPPKRSRGTIIPALLSASTLGKACAAALTLSAPDFAPFRLVMANRLECVEIQADGKVCVVKFRAHLDRPLMFTSSGLGDALVDAPRRALFEEYFVAGRDLRSQQDAYHRHAWPDRCHLSVCMSRPEARTVSLTIVELDAQEVRMMYYPEAPDQPIEPITASLEVAI